MDSVPFQVDLGLSTVQGILRLDEDGLAIEWRQFSMMGAPQGQLEVLKAPYCRLSQVEYERRFVGVRIAITADSPAVLKTFPLPSGDITTLRAVIKRAHRAQARAWAAEAALRIAESEDEP